MIAASPVLVLSGSIVPVGFISGHAVIVVIGRYAFIKLLYGVVLVVQLAGATVTVSVVTDAEPQAHVDSMVISSVSELKTIPVPAFNALNSIYVVPHVQAYTHSPVPRFCHSITLS